MESFTQLILGLQAERVINHMCDYDYSIEDAIGSLYGCLGEGERVELAELVEQLLINGESHESL